MIYFLVTVVVTASSGVAIAIAEQHGVIRAQVVFLVIGFFGVLYFLLEAVVLPYLKLKVSEGGFKVVDGQGKTYEVGWLDVLDISLEKTDGCMEWLIHTSRFGSIWIDENEYLFRGRLRRGAVKHLIGFNEAALEQAVRSKADGSWECFRRPVSAINSALPC